ncbi:NAD(P)H-binding protein [uncultured Marivirga sp.]|uniref:NAD(P)H-binding protein n=1 Tax=uncultured Marivirga sp. TaxID=1123707 RepID=UPI0030EE8E78
MKTLILGASGATGKLLVEQLLLAEQNIKVVIRPTAQIPTFWQNHANLEIISAEISKMKTVLMKEIVSDCNSVAVCLGHNLNFKGLFGKPRRLVTDAVRLLTSSILKVQNQKPIKLVLMNTAGNRNRDLKESISVSESLIITLLRLLLPPHLDNELAAEYLRKKIGKQNNTIEWVVVRPDSLIDESQVSQYSLLPSPNTSAIFRPGKTSRINVAHFMADLIQKADLWNKWKGQMPVIYNQI